MFEYGYVAPLVMGSLLILFGAFVAARRGDATRWWLATYLLLVGASHLLDGLGHALQAILRTTAGTAAVPDLLLHTGIVAAILDPAAVLLFAWGRARGRVAWPMTIVALPVLALAGVYVAWPPDAPWMSGWPLQLGYVLTTCFYYLGTFLLLLWVAVRASPAPGSPAGVLLTAFGVVLLPRIPLMALDMGWGTGTGPVVSAAATWGMAATLWALDGAAVGAAWLMARRSGPVPWRALATLAALHVPVACIWLLSLHPALQPILFGLWYSARWYLFAFFLLSAPGGPVPAGPPSLPHRFVSPLLGIMGGALGVALLWPLLAGDGAWWSGLGASLGIVAMVAVGVLLWRRLGPGPRRDLRLRRVAIYRAAVATGADPTHLANLRATLGLDRSMAVETERLARIEVYEPAPPLPVQPGTLFRGRYKVAGVVGAGTFGRTLRARDETEGRDVVLKEVSPRWRGDARVLRQFLRECRAAASVHHPNLVRYLDIEPVPDGHVLVLEYVEGRTLREVLARGSLAPARARRLACDLLEGLAALHAASIVHGDVKPENIVLTPSGRAVLLDFGAAMEARDRSQGTWPGTPAYMRPGRTHRGAPSVGDDLWAVAAVVREAMGGGHVPAAWNTWLAQAMREETPFTDAGVMLAGVPRSRARRVSAA